MKSTFKPLVRPIDALKPPTKPKAGQGVSPEVLFDELLSALAKGKMQDQPPEQGESMVKEAAAVGPAQIQAPACLASSEAAEQHAHLSAMGHLTVPAEPAAPSPGPALAATALASNQPNPYAARAALTFAPTQPTLAIASVGAALASAEPQAEVGPQSVSSDPNPLMPGMEPKPLGGKSPSPQDTRQAAAPLGLPATPALTHSAPAQPSTPVALESSPSEGSKDELAIVEPGAAAPGREALLTPHALAPAEAPIKTTLDAVPVPVAPHLPEMAESMAHDATLLAVRAGTTEHSSVQMVHPDLGAVSLELHTQQGCLEVTAVLQTEAAAKLVQANEQGLRHGAQRGGLSFSGLKVRVQGDEPSEHHTAGAKSRRERGKKN